MRIYSNCSDNLKIKMKLIDAWCPLCIRRICFAILRFLGIKRKKDESKLYEDETENKSIMDHEKDNLISDTHNWQKAQPSNGKDQPQSLPPNKPIKAKIQVTTEQLFDENEVLLEDMKLEEKQQHNTQHEQQTSGKSSSSLESPTKKLQQQTPNNPIIDLSSFKSDFSPEDRYYDLLQAKLKLLKDRLRVPTNLVPIDNTNNRSNLQIRHAQPGELNVFFYSFKLQCSYEFYQSMMNDYNIQKKLDSNIDQYYLLEQVNNNAKVNYISYKRVLAVSPRDFVFLKYSTSQEKQHWDLSFSVPHQIQPNIIRGQIILTVWKITETPQGLTIQVYSQVDMRLTVNSKITKTQSINEIRKNVERCYDYVKLNYTQQLV